MEIFKFGGSSIKDARHIENVGKILQQHTDKKLVVVISALGKTTNALEKVVNTYYQDSDYQQALEAVYKEHIKIARSLLKNRAFEATHSSLLSRYEKVASFLAINKVENYNYLYDQVVSLGELMSTTIVSAYLNQIGFSNQWLGVRDYIKTDHAYTEAQVVWTKTEHNISTEVPRLVKQSAVITQGFLGSTPEMLTTTLGREGSDFTAAIFAYCLKAKKMTVWKDVPGVLNADPRIFTDAQKIERLTYREAIEMSFYGAQVLHPKTIKPLQNRNIPLEVRSFVNAEEAGTVVQKNFVKEPKLPPVIVYKKNQVLLSFAVKDFSFIGEKNMSQIFHAFAENSMRINMMHNQAVSFSACVNYKKEKIDRILSELKEDFDIQLEKNLELLTIRHYTQKKYKELTEGKQILQQQKSPETVQVLMY